MIAQYNGFKAAYDNMLKPRNSSIEKLRIAVEAYNKKVAVYNASRDQNKRQEIAQELSAHRTRINVLKEQIRKIDIELTDTRQEMDRLRDEIEGYQVSEVPALTKALRAQASNLRAYNRAVFDAYYQTARFAAFFRYVKSRHEANWLTFLDQVKKLDVQPKVLMPTRWQR